MRNITIDTGSGNPRAGGVTFQASNLAEISNVEIRSGDGQGRYGIVAHRPTLAGWFHDITITGFERGISLVRSHVMNPAFEYVTLHDQSEAGIYVENCQPTIRCLASQNSVPAVVMEGTSTHLELVDSSLTAGSPDNPAIDMRVDGHAFVRNVTIKGYGVALRRGGEPEVVGGRINEYVSDPVITFDDDQPPRSLDLPVAEPPLTPWTSDHGRMADVGSFGAVGDGVVDDSAAIQAACDSGAEVIYFPAAEYRVEQTIDVPASVRRLACMFTTFRAALADGGLFRVSANCADPLIVEETQNTVADQDTSAFLVDHREPRPVVLNMVWNTEASAYRPHPTAANGDVYFNSVQGYGKSAESALRHQRVWARWINTENSRFTDFWVGEGATLWVLGYKCERGQINFDVFDGGCWRFWVA